MKAKHELKKGLFISFEGGEGGGKSTQLKLLVRDLEREGFLVRGVREPGGTKIGEAIRKITHDPTNTMLDLRAEALLFAASRAQIVAEIYRPLLEKKWIVVADRYVDSSYVYQGIARKLGFEEIKLINDVATGELMPDITFLLDIPHEVGHDRRLKTTKLDRMDLLEKSFYEAVRRGYHEIAKKYRDRIVVVDAAQDIETIHQVIYRQVIAHINQYLTM